MYHCFQLMMMWMEAEDIENLDLWNQNEFAGPNVERQYDA